MKRRVFAALAALVALLTVALVGGRVAPKAADTPAPRRIVSLIPAVTQILFAIGAGPQVVGVSTYDREPREVLGLPKVGGLIDPDIERILALRPDLVIVYEGQQELQSRLARARIQMFRYKHGDLGGVSATIREVGVAVGRAPQAEAAATRLDQALQRIAERVSGRPRPSALLVLGRERKTLRNINASGGYGFLHDMLVVAGGRDVFDDIKRESLQPSTEMVLARRPEVIIELRYGAEAVGDDDMTPWRRLSSMPAVRNGRLYQLVGDEFVEAGPFIDRATERIARVLHADAWR